jgi:hypothetical protein
VSLITCAGQQFRVTALPLEYEQGDDDARAVNGALRRTRLFGRKRAWRVTTELLPTAAADSLEAALDTGGTVTLDLTSLTLASSAVLVRLESRVPTTAGAGILWTLTFRATEV